MGAGLENHFCLPVGSRIRPELVWGLDTQLPSAVNAISGVLVICSSFP